MSLQLLQQNDRVGILQKAAVKGKGGEGSWPTSMDSLHQGSTRPVHRNAHENKQTRQEMRACGGTQATTAPLTSLLLEESEEVVKSMQSRTAGLFVLAKAEKDETSQQLSQDGDMDAAVAGRAVVLSSKGAPGLGEGGATSEGLRSSSLGQRHEAKSLPGLDGR